jgi:hypothetical protein
MVTQSIQLAELMTQVVEHMAEGPWHIEPRYEQSIHLVAEDGRRILAYHNTHTKRLEISGAWPRNEHNAPFISHWDDPPTITVSITRDPKAIGRDISRRFLPAFNEKWQIAIEAKRDHDAFLASQADTTRRIITAWKGEQYRDRDRIHVGSITTKGWYGEIDPHNGSVTMTLRSVPVAAAEEIAAVMEKYSEGDTE